MNILIVGGLFAIALLALIGIVFLIRSEPHTPKVPAGKVESEPLKVLETAEVAKAGTPIQPSLPTPNDEAVAEQQEIQRFPIANGQFHTLSVELHALHMQAQEIEHRLSVLTEMIERIERDQSHYTNVEGAVSLPREAASTN
ncbi:MAG: hypothetical protein NVS4B11_19550 [Ktedonobacteraceae bacterium]